MTKLEIIHATHSNFSEFLRIWRDHRREQGLGALVFVSEEMTGNEEEVSCEYWTLSELRQYMRRMQQYDEVFYKWLTNAEREGGYPIIIFSSGAGAEIEQLHFSSVKKAQVS